jgi:hypothetical protein
VPEQNNGRPRSDLVIAPGLWAATCAHLPKPTKLGDGRCDRRF